MALFFEGSTQCATSSHALVLARRYSPIDRGLVLPMFLARDHPIPGRSRAQHIGRERESTVARCRSLVSVVLYGESTRVLSREIHVTEGDASEGIV